MLKFEFRYSCEWGFFEVNCPSLDDWTMLVSFSPALFFILLERVLLEV
jgi:hypothetical protein